MRMTGVLVVMLGLASTAMAGEAVRPPVEQLLAAGISAADLKAVTPGTDWSDDSPDFAGPMTKKRVEKGFITFVTTQQMSWPAKEAVLTVSSVNLFTDAASASAAFKVRLADDIEDYGPVARGAPVGAESRYHIRPGNKDKSADSALRIRHGRYLVLIESESDKEALPRTALAKLAEKVIARLDQLGAGKLAAAPLPKIASLLPDGEGAPGPVLGTGALAPEAFAWVPGADKQVLSADLRKVLRQGMDGQGAIRMYSLSELAGHVVAVTLMPFRDEQGARAGLKANGQDGDYLVQAPDPSHGNVRWRVNMSVGRVWAEVDCYRADSTAPSADCKQLVETIAGAMKPRLTLF